MEVTASAKFLRISPKKVRPLLKDLRGKKVDEILAVLAYSPHKAGKLIYKLISSATANASNNYNIKSNNLRIKKLVADDGPTFKRQWMRSRGSADLRLKRTAHISVILEEVIPTPKTKIKPVTPKPKVSKVDEVTKPKEDIAKTTSSAKTESKKIDIKKIIRRTTNK